jgi:hypothetical protein
MELQEAEKCIFFHNVKKRCKQGKECRYLHDEKHPTEWQQRVDQEHKRRRRLEEGGKTPVNVQNFAVEVGPIRPSTASSNILRDRTTSLRAWFGKHRWSPDVQVAQSAPRLSSLVSDWVEVQVSGFPAAVPLAHDLVLRMKSVSSGTVYCQQPDDNKRVLIRCKYDATCPEFLYHGTDYKGFKGIMKSRRIWMTGTPKAVYCALSPEDVKISGYDLGFIIVLAPVAIMCSNATKKLFEKQPLIPGICLEMNQRKAKSEFILHSDSLKVVGFISPLSYLGGIIREEWGTASVAHSKSSATAAEEEDWQAQMERSQPNTNWVLEEDQIIIVPSTADQVSVKLTSII